MGLAENQFSYNNSNITVTFEVTDGGLKIKKEPVTITVDAADKTYGDNDPDFTGTVEGLVKEGDLGEVTYSRTNDDETVGTYDDVLTANYTANANYEVTVVPADFEIKQATMTITIKGAKVEETYDGTAKTAEGYTATSTSTLFDKSLIFFPGTCSVTKTEADT